MMPLDAPFAEMLSERHPLAPMSVLVDVQRRAGRRRDRVAGASDVDGAAAGGDEAGRALVASMSSPPPVKLMVAPVLLVRLTAVDVPPFSTLLAPENAIVPAALPSRKITLALPVECVIVPESVMLPAPAARSWMSTARAVPVDVIVPL